MVCAVSVLVSIDALSRQPHGTGHTTHTYAHAHMPHAHTYLQVLAPRFLTHVEDKTVKVHKLLVGHCSPRDRWSELRQHRQCVAPVCAVQANPASKTCACELGMQCVAPVCVLQGAAGLSGHHTVRLLAHEP